jgi:site-specific DNA-cytosine methylase
MQVLSLFDGMSCGQIALERTGIPVDIYWASELNKHAIKVTMMNYPKTIQLGDVLNWRNWPIDWSKIDLLIGGSPCQGFSFAGKHLAFDDSRSVLFFTYVEILNHIRKFNPDVKFLMENVKMKKDYLDIISTFLGVHPVFINSALVSAQNRQRYYWANWNFAQPDDLGEELKDVLESGAIDRMKSYAIDANYWKGGDLNQYFNKSRRQVVFKFNRKDGITKEIQKSLAILASDWRGLNRNQQQTAVVDFDRWKFRKLSPIECERLQNVPDNYTNHVANTNRYKMLGNGWTVNVIVHVFKGLIK